ncbi:head maturation protease, ClpP-related [Actinoplanes sp. N902-109]|uniref:head maturation protease, ClpP-related n=1 Tax=Actinoplanes sp. (strain N902-109) TaxID=649831 RepID=UPI000329510E|nr:head maturation protease, ClpP-related [Actinoplanes sp. N902-109]AGL19506.1 peptidase S14 ClpP [Actinoplanes sp. N902-109]
MRAEVITETDGTSAKVHIDDVIDSWGGYWGISAKEFNQALGELGDVDEITLHINSPGGEVFEGVAILNALRRHPATVTAVVDGLAASAASFIAVGVDKLVMGRNTELMIHDAWGIAIGPAADMHSMGERLDKLSDNIASMYADKAGGALGDWRSLMLAETWYTADEAVAAGLADEVEGGQLADDEIVAAAFDLSVFKHRGRAQAPAPAAAVADRPAPPAQAVDERRDRFDARRTNRHARRAAAHAAA